MENDNIFTLKEKKFLKLLDLDANDINGLLDLSAKLKGYKKNGKPHKFLEGKNIAVIFEKTSTRTRCAFEVAASDLGMHSTYLDPSGSQIGHKESIKDTARVLGRMFDGIEYRGFGQEIVEQLYEYANVPVWNGLTDEFHPTQILADFLTIKEKVGKLEGTKLVYMGDARYNMGNSLMVGCAKMGMHFVACCPAKYFPNKELINVCEEIAKSSGAILEFESDVEKAVNNADIIYTDVWVSMGESKDAWKERINDLKPYQVNSDVMNMTGKETYFMHCLPAFHNLETSVGRDIYNEYGFDALEVTDEVIESKNSVVFDEAENRMHTIKAVMLATLYEK